MGVYQFADLSTGHVTQQVFKALTSGPVPIRTVPHDYGVWVLVPNDDQMWDGYRECVEILDDIDWAPLTTVLEWAAKRECRWINFDQDGDPEQGDLPLHAW